MIHMGGGDWGWFKTRFRTSTPKKKKIRKTRIQVITSRLFHFETVVREWLYFWAIKRCKTKQKKNLVEDKDTNELQKKKIFFFHRHHQRDNKMSTQHEGMRAFQCHCGFSFWIKKPSANIGFISCYHHSHYHRLDFVLLLCWMSSSLLLLSKNNKPWR